jgi:peptidoglycan LD-endopeptidase CwlK
MAEFDDRSEKNLLTLRPKTQPHFRALLRTLKAYAATNGLDVKIISADRTWAQHDALYAQQDALYAQGRNGVPGPIVTNSRGGMSNHNYQIAVDLGLFKNNNYLEESVHYNHSGKHSAWRGAGAGVSFRTRRTIKSRPYSPSLSCVSWFVQTVGARSMH